MFARQKIMKLFNNCMCTENIAEHIILTHIGEQSKKTKIKLILNASNDNKRICLSCCVLWFKLFQLFQLLVKFILLKYDQIALYCLYK